MATRLKLSDYVQGVLSGDRMVLSRAITLVESLLTSDKHLAQQVLENILPHTGTSIRLGITGVPGVGKSTFIETFGNYITQKQKKIAILAIDPSSQLSGGSIMGDKTRMETLVNNPNAYIRPSPAGASLGGVAHKTRESILLCEAAGFDVVVVETVGVGQSETVVKGMVDFFLLLMLAGAGDELQGMKRGIMEMADALVITKADGENLQNARAAALEYEQALHLFPPNENAWSASVKTCSAVTNTGIAEIWEMIEHYVRQTQKNGFWQKNRQEQNVDWFYNYIEQEIVERFFASEQTKKQIRFLELAVREGKKLSLQAGRELLKQFTNDDLRIVLLNH